MPHTLRSVFSSRRLRNGLAAVISTAAVMAATLAPVKPASAFAGAVVINISGYSGAVAFNTTGHSIGTCNGYSWPNGYFSVNGSRVCEGDSFGGLYLYVYTPSGYQFNGFTVPYSSNGISTFSCGTNCQYIYFTGARSMTLQANFSAIPVYYPPSPPPAQPAPPATPSTPAAPIAPQASINGRTSNSVQVGWSTGSTPGGFNRYEVWQGNSHLWTTTNANWRTYNQTNLTCGGSSYSYNIRIYDNQGRYATSNTATGTTQACPAANSGGSSSGSSSGNSTARTTTSSSSSNRTTARTTTSSNTNGQPRLPNTGTSSTTTENETLAAADTDDSNLLFPDEVADTTSSSDDRIPEEQSTKKGLSNIEKVVIGLMSVALLAGVMRYLYVKQAAKQSNYWS